MSKQEDGAPPRVAGISAFWVGLLVNVAISVVTGRDEAWDSPLYYVVGIPLMCVAIGFISYRFPRNPGRWTFFMSLGQCVAAVVMGGGVGVLIIALLFMMVLSLPQFITAVWTSRMGLSRQLKDRQFLQNDSLASASEEMKNPDNQVPAEKGDRPA